MKGYRLPDGAVTRSEIIRIRHRVEHDEEHVLAGGDATGIGDGNSVDDAGLKQAGVQQDAQIMRVRECGGDSSLRAIDEHFGAGGEGEALQRDGGVRCARLHGSRRQGSHGRDGWERKFGELNVPDAAAVSDGAKIAGLPAERKGDDRGVGETCAEARPSPARDRDIRVRASEHANVGGDVESIESAGVLHIDDEIVDRGVGQVAADVGPRGAAVDGLEDMAALKA